jgi:hypothetical protein
MNASLQKQVLTERDFTNSLERPVHLWPTLAAPDRSAHPCWISATIAAVSIRLVADQSWADVSIESFYPGEVGKDSYPRRGLSGSHLQLRRRMRHYCGVWRTQMGKRYLVTRDNRLALRRPMEAFLAGDSTRERSHCGQPGCPHCTARFRAFQRHTHSVGDQTI